MSDIAPNNRRRKEKWQMIWKQGFTGYAVFRVELTSGKQGAKEWKRKSNLFAVEDLMGVLECP